MGGRFRGLGKKGEGIKKYKLAVRKLSRGLKCSLRNVVDNIVTLPAVPDGHQTSWGDYFVRYTMSNH